MWNTREKLFHCGNEESVLVQKEAGTVSSRSGRCLQGTSVVGKKNMVQSIEQLFKYLVFASLSYGAISTRDATFLSKGLVTMRCMSRKGFSGTKKSF